MRGGYRVSRVGLETGEGETDVLEERDVVKKEMWVRKRCGYCTGQEGG